MVTLLTNIFILMQNAGGKEMMAMLWAQQIILGKKTYGQVPRLLKDKVKEILEDSGMTELVKEDEEKA
jgi:dihydrofolate reductase